MLRLLVVAAQGPVVLVPGLLSSQVMMKLGEEYEPPRGCARHEGWFRTWANGLDMLPFRPKCLFHRLATPWGPAGPENRPGVETKIEGWGSTSSIDVLSPNLPGLTTVFDDLIDALMVNGLDNEGEDQRIFGAPYDWRFGPHSSEGQTTVARLMQLVEQAHRRTGEKVLLVSHSMGERYVLALLQEVGKEWQQEHLRGWAAVSAPFGGAVDALAGMLVGKDEGIPTVRKADVRKSMRTWESSWQLLPDPRVYGDTVLAQVQLDDRVEAYSAKQLANLFDQMDWHSSGVEPRTALHLVHRHSLGAEEIHTPLHCFFSTGVKTVQALQFSDLGLAAGWAERSSLQGDGSVDERSLRHCERLRPKSVHVYDGIEHRATLTDIRVLRDLVDLALAEPEHSVSRPVFV